MPTLPLAPMSALARRFPAEHVHWIDLPYRLSSWALDEPANAAWWAEDSADTHAGRPDMSVRAMRAWAVLQAPFWTIDCACDPAAEDELYPRILEWAERRAREVRDTPHERPAWFVNVFAHQAGRRRALEAAGFVEQTDVGADSWSKVWMRRSADAPLPASTLPPGYVVRPLAGVEEVPAYVDLHRTVFESKSMTAAWRARTLQQPAYRPALDLLAVAPDNAPLAPEPAPTKRSLGAASAPTNLTSVQGAPAGFCILWLEGETGQVEPLGVHPDYRRLGLGQALLAEGLRRLHALGAREVYVETDNDRTAALGAYEAAGFRVVERILVYRKDSSARA